MEHYDFLNTNSYAQQEYSEASLSEQFWIIFLGGSVVLLAFGMHFSMSLWSIFLIVIYSAVSAIYSRNWTSKLWYNVGIMVHRKNKVKNK